jgi:truncated hemoglobin YjbI
MSTGGPRGAESKDYRRLFQESYLRCVVNDQEGFFLRFYQLFTAADEEVSRVFAKTNMERQVSMLQESLLYMIHFSDAKLGEDRMRRIATHHGSDGMKVPRHLFDLWMDCLVETARERDDEFDSDIEVAWRVFLAPAVAFVKAHCAP